MLKLFALAMFVLTGLIIVVGDDGSLETLLRQVGWDSHVRSIKQVWADYNPLSTTKTERFAFTNAESAGGVDQRGLPELQAAVTQLTQERDEARAIILEAAARVDKAEHRTRALSETNLASQLRTAELERQLKEAADIIRRSIKSRAEDIKPRQELEISLQTGLQQKAAQSLNAPNALKSADFPGIESTLRAIPRFVALERDIGTISLSQPTIESHGQSEVRSDPFLLEVEVPLPPTRPSSFSERGGGERGRAAAKVARPPRPGGEELQRSDDTGAVVAEP